MTLPAYLIISRIAIFNDEWYDDYTDSESIADPLGLFLDRDEAEDQAQRMARLFLQKTPVDELLLGETFEEPDDGDLHELLESMFNREIERLPAGLSDAQLDEILRLSDLKPYHVIEADLSREQFAEAQSILTSTPDHPDPVIRFDPETGYPVFDEHENLVFDYQNDEATERLDRVTQLFGRHYATHPIY